MPTTPIATSIVQKLADAGHIAYFAGGWVRDFLMQKPSDDIDIATSAPISLIQTLFPKTIPVGINFGIIIVVEEGHPFEVATFRKDREYTDGRRPIGFDPASAEEDAKRRDFTINGMFYDPLHKKLLDFVEGQQDIQKKVIRAIGNPHERFFEDRLRMMRAVRYATRFGFTIDQETSHAILAHASELLPAVAMERIWQEFKKMSKFAHFNEGLVLLHSLKLLPTIFPQLKEVSVETIKERVQWIEQIPKQAPPIAELLELFPHASLEELLELSDTLKLSKEERLFVIAYHEAFSLLQMPLEWQNALELFEWAHFYAKPHTHLILEIFKLRLTVSQQEVFTLNHTNRQTHLSKSIDRIRHKNPLIAAQDLLDLNILPGKELGNMLKEAEKLSINEGIEDKSILLKRIILKK